MKLKYRTGYFFSIMMVVLGTILSMANIDSNKYVMFTGAIGVVFFVSYYFISDFNKDYNWRQWGNLGACLVIVLSLALHFALKIKVDYFIFGAILLIKNYEKKPQSKLNISTNE